DIIEIPEADHPVNERWRGISEEQRNSFFKCLNRHISISVSGQTMSVALTPRGAFSVGTPKAVRGNPVAPQTPPPSPYAVARTVNGELTIAIFWATEVLQASGLLRTSSNLRQVKVTRTDPKTKSADAAVANLEGVEPGSANDLWLRDGDVIEIP